ncbi:hypothetical protein [Bradyrhizobium sp.]
MRSPHHFIGGTSPENIEAGLSGYIDETGRRLLPPLPDILQRLGEGHQCCLSALRIAADLVNHVFPEGEILDRRPDRLGPSSGRSIGLRNVLDEVHCCAGREGCDHTENATLNRAEYFCEFYAFFFNGLAKLLCPLFCFLKARKGVTLAFRESAMVKRQDDRQFIDHLSHGYSPSRFRLSSILRL